MVQRLPTVVRGAETPIGCFTDTRAIHGAKAFSHCCWSRDSRQLFHRRLHHSWYESFLPSLLVQRLLSTILPSDFAFITTKAPRDPLPPFCWSGYCSLRLVPDPRRRLHLRFFWPILIFLRHLNLHHSLWLIFIVLQPMILHHDLWLTFTEPLQGGVSPYYIWAPPTVTFDEEGFSTSGRTLP